MSDNPYDAASVSSSDSPDCPPSSGWSIWVPAFAMMLVSLISYVDRNVLAVLAPTIREATKINETDYGWAITGFSIAYMIGNPVWGWILDRFGLRIGMTAAVLFWTLASASHAWVTGFWELALARAFLGFGEGATFPGGLRAVMLSLPGNARARGVAIAYSGGSLGAIVAPWIVTPIEAVWGWRAAFLFTGLIGVVWVVAWQFVARRPDMRHQRILHADTTDDSAERPSWFDGRSWAFMFAYALGGSPLGFILYYSASYLKSTFGFSQTALGAYLWIPPLGWEIGYFFWGWAADRWIQSATDRRAAHWRLFLLLSALSLLLALLPFCNSFPLVMTIMFLAMSTAAGFIIVAIAYATGEYSRQSSGLIAGMGAGAWGAGVAVVSPLHGYLFDRKLYAFSFGLGATIPVAGLLLWWALSRSRRGK
jgi:ACS family hexuronate transporter-like MFS transporter